MAYSPLNETNVFKRWEDSKKYTDQLTQPFTEFQRIASNQPYPGADPAYPSVTDGTTASIIQKTPKRVVQQIPTGVVESDGDEDWLCDVAQFIFTNKIIPYANEDYGLFEKSQLIIENGLAFGFGVSYAPFLNHDGYFCPDMTLPYWGDVYIQKGKKSGRSCEYVFLRSWWQPEDIDALIKREQEMSDAAKKRGETYESTWDPAALQEVKDKLASKDAQALTPNEQERGVNVSAVEFVTAFQKGVGAKFFTFNPASKQVVRTKTNKDPRGAMPLDWFYGDIDGTSPLGRSIVELIGPLQNLIDSDMQAYQYNRALALQPPVVKYGNLGNFSFAPNEVVDASNDPNAKIVPLTVDTSALTNYPSLYGLQKSQLLNLVSSPDTSISADVGNPGFSKTPAGINQQKASISVDDNAIRKSFETWFQAWGETAINLYFAERSGTESLQLDKQTADRLRKLPEFQAGDGTPENPPGPMADMLSDDNKIIIDYDTETPVLKFCIDASTSKMKDDADQLNSLSGLIQALDTSPTLAQLVPPEKQLALWNSMVTNSGVEDPEELTVDLEKFKEDQQAAQQQQMALLQQQAQMQPAQAAQPPMDQPQEQPQEPPLVSHLRQLGLSDGAIHQVVHHVVNQPQGAQ